MALQGTNCSLDVAIDILQSEARRGVAIATAKSNQPQWSSRLCWFVMLGHHRLTPAFPARLPILLHPLTGTLTSMRYRLPTLAGIRRVANV